MEVVVSGDDGSVVFVEDEGHGLVGGIVVVFERVGGAGGEGGGGVVVDDVVDCCLGLNRSIFTTDF